MIRESGCKKLAVTAAAVLSTATAAGRAVEALSACSVLVCGLVAGVADVAVAVAGLIALEVVEGLRAATRHGAVVAMVGIVAVVDVAVESMMAVIPGPSPDEYAPDEPIRPIVAIG